MSWSLSAMDEDILMAWQLQSDSPCVSQLLSGLDRLWVIMEDELPLAASASQCVWRDETNCLDHAWVSLYQGSNQVLLRLSPFGCTEEADEFLRDNTEVGPDDRSAEDRCPR